MSKQTYSKAKGREAEAAVVDYLRQRGVPAERRRQTGAADCGDVGGVKGLVIEVKAEKRLNLAGYMDELAVECINAQARLCEPNMGFVVAKRRGSQDPGTWYAVLPFRDMLKLLKVAGLVPS